jgi:GrpB-like predicted nucleotidyltransferase (UPF0157 family)/predicted kinase
VGVVMIIIITGPCGIGKTSVSEALVTRFDRAVMLDGDYIGAVHPFDIYDAARIDYLYRTLQLLVAFHVREGHYHDFVLNYVFESPASLADLRQRLAPYDDEIYAFRLTAADAAIADRIIKREGQDGEAVAWYLNRYQDLVAIQEQAARYGDMGFEIDTTGCTADQTAGLIWDNVHESVALVPYDAKWEQQYAVERALIAEALGEQVLAIHHIGSTAVPGLIAKPVIDIMVVVPSLADAVPLIYPLRLLGYRYINYPQNTDRWFFRKGIPRTHHIHIVEEGSATLRDHLDFRDALFADAAAREAYAKVKEALAAEFATERARYAENKGSFVASTLKGWRNR